MNPNLKEFTTDNFDAEVVRSPRPVLVNFWAEWNGMSRELAPTLEKLADEFAGRAGVGRVDTDANVPLTRQYGVESLPTTVIFKAGKMSEKLLGVQPEAALRAALAAAMLE